MDLDELSFDNIGTFPWTVKAVIISLLCVAVIGLAFWFDTRAQLKVLKKEQKKERTHRQKFEKKSHQASNLEEYKKQLIEIKKSFGELLRRLPEETEVPGLLEDISKVGTASGLHFLLFKPLAEKKKEFYVTLPIKIEVVGTYHQFGVFVSQVAALPRIVTLGDFKITPYNAKKGSGTKKGNKASGTSGERLLMSITAKTYRYVE